MSRAAFSHKFPINFIKEPCCPAACSQAQQAAVNLRISHLMMMNASYAFLHLLQCVARPSTVLRFASPKGAPAARGRSTAQVLQGTEDVGCCGSALYCFLSLQATRPCPCAQVRLDPTRVPRTAPSNQQKNNENVRAFWHCVFMVPAKVQAPTRPAQCIAQHNTAQLTHNRGAQGAALPGRSSAHGNGLPPQPRLPCPALD